MFKNFALSFLITSLLSNGLFAGTNNPNLTTEDGWVFARSECQHYQYGLYGNKVCHYRSTWTLVEGTGGQVCFKGTYCAFYQVYNPGGESCRGEHTITLCPSKSTEDHPCSSETCDLDPFGKVYFPLPGENPFQEVLRRRAKLTLDCHNQSLYKNDGNLMSCKLKD